MIHILVSIAVAGGCIAVGAIGHSFIAKEASIVKADAASWAKRLRDALNTETQLAKVKLTSLAEDIEKKL
jgi:hypothetical protein